MSLELPEKLLERLVGIWRDDESGIREFGALVFRQDIDHALKLRLGLASYRKR